MPILKQGPIELSDLKDFITVPDFSDAMIKEGMYSNKWNLNRFLHFFFGNLDLKGKQILDIGGGSGLLTFFAAAGGANVICLEPEGDGSSRGMHDRFRNVEQILRPLKGSAELIPMTFQQYNNNQESFDLLVLGNSINHIDEEDCVKAHFDQMLLDCFEAYILITNN